MNALILGLLLSQASATLTISVRVVRPTCVAVQPDGTTRVVERRALGDGERSVACSTDPAAAAPTVVQRVERPATADAPEERLVEIFY